MSAPTIHQRQSFLKMAAVARVRPPDPIANFGLYAARAPPATTGKRKPAPLWATVVCVNAWGVSPTVAVFAERVEQRQPELVARSWMQDKPERAGFAFHLVQEMRRRDSHFHHRWQGNP